MNFRLLMPLLLLAGFQSKGQQKDSIQITYQKPLFDFDKRKPLFKLKDEQLSNTYRHLRFAAITGYREGATPTTGSGSFDSYIDVEHGTTRAYMYNLPKQEILTMGFIADNDIVLDVKEPSKYKYDSSQGSKLDWMRKNSYCFELMMPSGTINDVKVLNEELEHFFGVKINEEKCMVNVLVLVRTSKEDKIRSLGNGEPKYNMQGYFNNISIRFLSEAMTRAGLPHMIDETWYSGKVDLDLKINSWNDLLALRKALGLYDLDLKPEKREINMLVIHEAKKTQ